MKNYLARKGDNARQDLAVEYARIFLAAGTYDGDTAVPYESVYTSEEGLLMQDSRDEVVYLYGSNGLKIDDAVLIPEDHLGFELEFMALMCNRIALKLAQNDDTVADVLETALAFIDKHLLNWVPLLQKRVEDFARRPFYPGLVQLTLGFIHMNRDDLLEDLRQAGST
jgi:TorA maturation chaperone TorD